MRAIGLDLSLSATGVCGPEGACVLRPGKRAGMERLAWLRDEVMALCCTGGIGNKRGTDADLVAAEGYAFGRHNQAHQLGELGGVIRLALWEAGIPVVEIPPATLKKLATGHGNASKGEVLAAAIRRLGYEGHDDNEADARWLYEAAAQRYGFSDVRLPAAQVEAIEGLEWPEGLG